MIIYNGHSVVDLGDWHLWFPVIPIRLTARLASNHQRVRTWWRWMYTVQRRNIYDSYSGEYMWTDYRDIIG